MDWANVRERLFKQNDGIARYEVIAEEITRDITFGRLRPGERLPTVRHLASELGVSATTVAAAYNLLNQERWINSEVGRGTFVSSYMNDRSGNRSAINSNETNFLPSGLTSVYLTRTPPAPSWRRRALMASAARLRAAHSNAFDCSTGRPDTSLLPLTVLQKAWKKAIDATQHADLQYASPEPVASLIREILPRLNGDGVAAQESDLIVASSAQQFMVLAMQIVAAMSGRSEIVVAVEEPGYPTIFDAYERAGCKLVGVDVDEQGALPQSLDAALSEGINAVLLTPRAHNPTGASWSVDRMMALADVLAAYPGVIAIEDDHFAGATATRPGSLISDRRIEDRVIYIRSFSKSMGPDLRIAVAVARTRLRTLIAEAESFADGWCSHLTQRALANALADVELDSVLAAARSAYTERRICASRVLQESLGSRGGWAVSGTDGLNIWVHLPPGVDSVEVIERAATSGVIVASGEPFFIRPGRSDVVRLNAGAVSAERVMMAAKALSTAAMTAVDTTGKTIPV